MIVIAPTYICLEVLYSDVQNRTKIQSHKDFGAAK